MADEVAKRLAKHFGVSERTIRRDGEFAAALEYLATVHGKSFCDDILNGQRKIPRSKVIAMHREALGNMSTDNRVGLYVKISPDAHATLSRLATQADVTMSDIVELLINQIRE